MRQSFFVTFAATAAFISSSEALNINSAITSLEKMGPSINEQARLDGVIVDACIACHKDRGINIGSGSIVTDWLAEHRLSEEIGELEEEEEEYEETSPFIPRCRAVCTGEAR